jgi:probable phosphoglycerate mutase
MQIFLIRHGQTTGDIEDRYGGDYDDHLSEEGKKQAQKLAQKLVGKGIQIIYHSPLRRAKETAKYLEKSLNVPALKVQNLRERNHYGILTGMVKADAKKKHAREVEELGKGHHHNVKGSEKYADFHARVTKAFGNIVENTKYSTVAIITHGGVIRFIVREILKKGELESLGDCEVLFVQKDKKNYRLQK